jgi:hypothetical protein
VRAWVSGRVSGRSGSCVVSELLSLSALLTCGVLAVLELRKR